ncbi:MAG: hypothetical protein JWM80_4896 [Cyanobacteria bacterium RYN_339]|nr:hypothetical protein [Cyanobacteria bacterium RYN_339]
MGRPGYSLIDVALASVIVAVGMMGASRFFTSVYADLSPQANGGGLRRYIMAEGLMKAQAEAMRATRFLAATPAEAKLVMEPAKCGLVLNVTVSSVDTTPALQYATYDLVVTDQNSTIGTLSISCLRALSGSINGKVGL